MQRNQAGEGVAAAMLRETFRLDPAARETFRLDSKGLDMALPLSVAVPEEVTSSAEEMLLPASLPLSRISPDTARKNSLVIDVCGLGRPSVLLAHAPNAWIQIFWEFLGFKGADPP